jgi:hypothetical protein
MKSPDDRTPTDFDLRELDSLRGLDSHQEIAIARAMDYCATHQIHPPEWLVEAAALLMVDLLKREKSTQRGRTASCLARFRHEFWDMERWDAVQEVRRIRSMAKQDEYVLKANPKIKFSESRLKSHKKRKDWLKRDNFECAAMLLKGRDANASPSAVRRSYTRVQRALAHGPVAQGAWFDDPFLKRLGLEGYSDSKTPLFVT